ncbi:S-adenosyl-L-methionine-dependent methyltransferase [Dipodascopsis uninucleata]
MGRRGRNERPRVRDQKGWVEIEKHNQAFVDYYREQGIIPQGEWDTFYDSCKTTLPVTFRFTGSKQHAFDIRDILVKEYIPFLTDITWDGEKVEAPTSLPWYPNELAWQIRVGKTVIRKSKPFSRFQKFLVTETDVGNISRQEAVSMIPPLLLEVQPHHTVIDLCAAPGSKTAQLIEAVHAIPEPAGFVVANDSDHKRSHMLIHQVKRLNSPNLIVTNHDAQLYPRIKVDENNYLRYDRVLCDVPCSGDGTMRKNINVWRDWNCQNGLGLHATQINIVNRGLHLLKPGGRLVYSTCSLNPVENEAVVAEILRQWKGKVKIVDCADKLPGLIRRKGVTQWKVMGRDKQWKAEPGPGLPKSVFPQEDLSDLNIERCMRVYPHDQDTGGFFITLLEKLTDNGVPADISNKNSMEASEKRAADSDADHESAKRQKTEASDNIKVPDIISKSTIEKKKERLPRDANEEPFKFLPANHPSLDNCWSFYAIASSFPRNSLLVRNTTGEPLRIIYYVHPTVRPIISLNDTKVKFIHAGIKLFAYQKSLEAICPWRVQSEGINLLYSHIDQESNKKRVVTCNMNILEFLCKNSFPRFGEFEDKDFMRQITDLSEGCVFLEVKNKDSERDDTSYSQEKLVFPMWRGRSSVNLMLPKQDTAELLLRFFKVEETVENDENVSVIPQSEEATVDTEKIEPASEIELTAALL